MQPSRMWRGKRCVAWPSRKAASRKKTAASRRRGCASAASSVGAAAGSSAPPGTALTLPSAMTCWNGRFSTMTDESAPPKPDIAASPSCPAAVESRNSGTPKGSSAPGAHAGAHPKSASPNGIASSRFSSAPMHSAGSPRASHAHAGGGGDGGNAAAASALARRRRRRGPPLWLARRRRRRRPAAAASSSGGGSGAVAASSSSSSARLTPAGETGIVGSLDRGAARRRRHRPERRSPAVAVVVVVEEQLVQPRPER